MYYEDNHIKIYNKDCRFMTELPDESVQMVCCSPPYWGLRKYSGEQELIWGDKNCEHDFSIPTAPRRSRTANDCPNQNTISAGSKGSYYNAEGGNTCSLCGAWKGAYGLEPTPEMYIHHTIEILREIRRVLRKGGVVFWNIGDSYVGGKGQSGVKSQEYQDARVAKGLSLNRVQQTGGPGETRALDNLKSLRASNLKPKDLCLIPFRIAIACQEAGWWVRSVIIWSKPNPMPESVTDRPTESHEYILMLTKSARYYWDADVVREELQGVPSGIGGLTSRDTLEKSGRSDWRWDKSKQYLPTSRNIRSVWEFPTQPYPEAHFAVFPEKLPEICIKAATPEVGCCSKCGSPWERITKHHRPDDYDPSVVDERYSKEARKASGHNGTNRPLSEMFKDSLGSSIETLGWQPTCKCNADKAPSVVLDPFAGAGTTLWVAKKLNRRAVGYEISEEYCQLAVERNRQQVLI